MPSTVPLLRCVLMALVETASAYLGTSVNPIQMATPVYGTLNTKFVSFLAPGIMVEIAFSHAIAMTALAFVKERNDNTLDRVLAAGVKSPTIVAAHFITHIVIIVLQTALMLVLAVLGFHLPIRGPIIIVAGLLLLLAATGMSFGLFVSSIARQGKQVEPRGITFSEIDAIQIGLASFLPSLLLSGILWPVEAV